MKHWRIALPAALAGLLGAGALAWMLVPSAEPAPEAPAQPAAEAPAASREDEAVRLAAARRAAFPDGPIVYEDALEIVFAGSRLVDTSFGPVLLSEGQVRNFGHVTPGRIAVHYLRTTGEDGFEVGHAFPRAIESGSNGRLSSWQVSDQFTELPVVYVEGGGTWQGFTCSWATLAELTPRGPQTLAIIPLAYDNGGAVLDEAEVESFDGRIVNIERGRSFQVAYGGNRRFTDTYLYRDGRFVMTEGQPKGWC